MTSLIVSSHSNNAASIGTSIYVFGLATVLHPEDQQSAPQRQHGLNDFRNRSMSIHTSLMDDNQI
jgi:hypothetical protein